MIVMPDLKVRPTVTGSLPGPVGRGFSPAERGAGRAGLQPRRTDPQEPIHKDTMSSTDAPTRPAALWKGMTEEQRHQAAEAFWEDGESIAEQTEVMLLLSKKLNFRYRTVQGLSLERKVAHLMKLGNLSDSVAGRLLITYHLTLQRPMMGAFLDALGIAHENGLIAADDTPKPDPASLAQAAATLRSAYPPEDVRLYFATLTLQDPETWGGLTSLIDPAPPESAV